jgi:hypothetical protein
MINPILSEMVAREQYRDRLRAAEQAQLAAEATRRPAQGFDLRAWLGNLLFSVRYRCKALARAD